MRQWINRIIFDQGLSRWLWIALFLMIGMIGTAGLHRAQVFSGFDLIPGRMGDTRLIMFLFDHWLKVFSGVADWASPMMMYPIKGTLGYSDMVFGHGVLHAGLRLLGLDFFDATVALIVLLSALAYVAAGFFLRQVFQTSLLATSVGASFFAFSSIKAMNMGPYQLHVYGLIPVVLLCFGLLLKPAEGIAETSRLKVFTITAAGLLSLAVLFNSGWYLAWFSGFFILLTLLVLLMHGRGQAWLLAICRQHWFALLAAIGLFILSMLPFLQLYLPARALDQGHLPTVPSWPYLINMGSANFLWGWLQPLLPAVPEESRMGVGYVMLLLWALAFPWSVITLLRGSRAVRSELWILAVMVLATSCFTLLAIRWPGGFSLWDWVVHIVPGADAVRGLQRYMMMLTAPLAAMLAMTIDACLKRGWAAAGKIRWAWTVPVLALGLMVMSEQISGSFGVSAAGQRAYFQSLEKQLTADCTLFSVRGPGPATLEPSINEIPNINRKYQADAIILAGLSGIPTINGFSGLYPINYGLYKLYAQDYELRVMEWLNRHQIRPTPCVVELPPFNTKEIRR
jgi:hypothetical protein